MLVFKGDQILVRDGTMEIEDRPAEAIRCSLDLPAACQAPTAWCEVGEGFKLGPNDELIGLRQAWQRFGDGDFARAGGAWQFLNWHRSVRLCSACGAPLAPSETNLGRVCPKCKRTFYAPLSPAIIVAVVREGKLLLAHNAAMPAGRFSVLAGVVEPGETLEETVAREVREEVAIEVQDIRYFGSQPWPFPHSLMLGFTARWKSGELHPDGVEIGEAGWFAPEDIPENIPDRASISRRLIDHFMASAAAHDRHL